MNDDRLTHGNEPSFDIDYQAGRQGELFVYNIIKAMEEGAGRVEVKTDRLAAKTGNVYIEYKCKKATGWENSGISSTEAELWAFVINDGNAVVVIATEHLKQLARAAHRAGRVAAETDGSHPTKGILVRLSDLVGYGTTAPLVKPIPDRPEAANAVEPVV